MNSLENAVAGIEASAAPYVEAITFRIEDGRVQTYFTMTDDENAPPFARVVEAVPNSARRLDAEIRASGGSLHVSVCLCDCVGDDGKPELGDGFILASPARGGSPH